MSRAAGLMVAGALAAVVAACGNAPRAPDWQMNAHDGLQRYVAAFLAGNARVEASEFAAARQALASTGRPGLVARAELTRCAAQVASLQFDPCDGFERLRADAPAGERAYADYLAGRVAPADVALLPPQHRAVAADTGALAAIDDPFAKLVAAGVLLRTNRATPAALAAASDTASAQGWRRPLLAWLGVQALRAEQAGDAQEAQRLRRRMALVSGEP
jgi:hypothetical protein